MRTAASRDTTGRYARRRAPWTPDRWDDGYVDSKGRFRVYRPDYPRAYAGGYALRAHVVWWIAHGEAHPDGWVLHHRNEVKTDDRLENLALLLHGAHNRHHKFRDVHRSCRGCGRSYSVPSGKRGRSRYCSHGCYQATGGRWRSVA